MKGQEATRVRKESPLYSADASNCETRSNATKMKGTGGLKNGTDKIGGIGKNRT
jgi:hypothetical protein